MGFCCCQPIHFRLFQFKCGISLFFFFFFLSFFFSFFLSFFFFLLLLLCNCQPHSNVANSITIKTPCMCIQLYIHRCLMLPSMTISGFSWFSYSFSIFGFVGFSFFYFGSHTPEERKRESDFCSHISFRLPNAHFPLTIIQTNTEKTDVIELRSGGRGGEREKKQWGGKKEWIVQSRG